MSTNTGPDVAARIADASKMRCWSERGVVHDALDGIEGTLARRATSAICDRDEAWSERSEA